MKTREQCLSERASRRNGSVGAVKFAANFAQGKSRAAFTLVEIMIVMAIVGIIMATGVPSMMRAMQKDDLSRAVRDVIEGCKTARDRAILQGVPWAFLIRENGQLDVQAMPREEPHRRLEATEVVEGQVSGLGEEGRSSESVSGSLYSGFPRQLGEDVMVQLIDVNFMSYMEAPEARVRFFPNGTADEFTVVMAWKGKQRTVTVDIITGLATEYIAE